MTRSEPPAEVVEDLKKRVAQFNCLELPGQPMGMHMGTSYLVNDLMREIERLRASSSLGGIEGGVEAARDAAQRTVDAVDKACRQGRESFVTTDAETVARAFLGLKFQREDALTAGALTAEKAATKDGITVGAMVKVHLPGESPWAEVVVVYDDGSWHGRIANQLFAEMPETERARWTKDNFGTVKPLPRLHDYKQNQIVLFIHGEPDFPHLWTPAPKQDAAVAAGEQVRSSEAASQSSPSSARERREIIEECAKVADGNAAVCDGLVKYYANANNGAREQAVSSALVSREIAFRIRALSSDGRGREEK